MSDKTTSTDLMAGEELAKQISHTSKVSFHV